MSYFDNVRHGFCRNEHKGVVYFTIPSFSSTGLVSHGFSSRIGGVSTGAFESLCFSLSRENNMDNFRENTRRFTEAAGVDMDAVTLVNYAHGDGIYLLKDSDAGKGLSKENDIPKCDALVCSSPKTAAMTMHADCVPIFVLDREKKKASVAHAGWRGVVKRLPEKIVRFFIDTFDSKAKDILTGIGPHISKCCFEVGEDVKDIFDAEFGSGSWCMSGGKIFADMQYAVLRQFEQMEIPPGNVTVSDMCTFCEQDMFYSHRRDHGSTGAMACLMQVK